METIASKVAALMPSLTEALERLVAIPSVAFPGYPAEPVEQMGREALDLVRAAGFTNAELMPVPSGYPPIYAEVPGPPGSPVVMLYAHYDVQPAPPEQGWTSDPWTPTRKDDGRIYGRGTADDKGGLVAHLGTMRAFDGRPPCTVRLIVEGMEETESNLPAFVKAHPDLFVADLFIICDTGNLRVAEPVFTTALRGDVACVVTVRTLEHPLHSGVFGGPAPDAMMALARLLASLHDDNGDVAVVGASTATWDGTDFGADEFRASADIRDGVGLAGTGPISQRLWARPSVNAIGVDMTSVAGSSNVLIPQARAKLSMRIVPGADPDKELDALADHLTSHAPGAPRSRWNAPKPRRRSPAGPTDRATPRRAGAYEEAFGKTPGEAGNGGSIPLLRYSAGRLAGRRVHPVGSVGHRRVPDPLVGRERRPRRAAAHDRHPGAVAAEHRGRLNSGSAASAGHNAEVDSARTTSNGGRLAATTAVVVAYALMAAVCRPLTGAALGAVLVAGAPLFWVGVRRRPRRAAPVGRRSVAVWSGLGVLAALFELGVFLGPDDAAHPTLSTLADPLLSTYPGRVLGYLLWVGAGLWLVSR